MDNSQTQLYIGSSKFTKVDGPDFPKLKTPAYEINTTELEEVRKQIESSLCFGQLLEGFMGKHEMRFNEMAYGRSIDIPFLTNFRDAKNESGESLSTHYSFNKGRMAMNVFLLVKNPWGNLIRKKDGIYVVQGAVRCSDEGYLPRVRSELQKIIETSKALGAH